MISDYDHEIFSCLFTDVCVCDVPTLLPMWPSFKREQESSSDKRQYFEVFGVADKWQLHIKLVGTKKEEGVREDDDETVTDRGNALKWERKGKSGAC